MDTATLDPDTGAEVEKKFGDDWTDRFLKKNIRVRDLEKITNKRK